MEINSSIRKLFVGVIKVEENCHHSFAGICSKKKSLLDLLHSLSLSRLSLTVFTDVFAVCVLEFLLFFICRTKLGACTELSTGERERQRDGEEISSLESSKALE